ncbi:MAG: DNA-binding response regulator [Caldilineae bacterium]|nr:MAG: DNA-binding response regulator [Caldilineae bacterium]
MTPSPIRVLIADDHGVVREGLRAVLEQDDIEVIGEAGTGRQAVELVERVQPDVVLLDIRMPDMNGLEALAIIKEHHPEVRVIVLTTYGTPDYLTRALQAGADGYLSKDADPGSIPGVVRSAVFGERLLDRELLRAAMGRLQTRSAPVECPVDNPLSEREMEVLRLIVAGYSNEAIAEALTISLPTVKTHVRHILEKLNVADRTQAAVWAVRHGLG